MVSLAEVGLSERLCNGAPVNELNEFMGAANDAAFRWAIARTIDDEFSSESAMFRRASRSSIGINYSLEERPDIDCGQYYKTAEMPSSGSYWGPPSFFEPPTTFEPWKSAFFEPPTTLDPWRPVYKFEPGTIFGPVEAYMHLPKWSAIMVLPISDGTPAANMFQMWVLVGFASDGASNFIHWASRVHESEALGRTWGPSDPGFPGLMRAWNSSRPSGPSAWSEDAPQSDRPVHAPSHSANHWPGEEYSSGSSEDDGQWQEEQEEESSEQWNTRRWTLRRF